MKILTDDSGKKRMSNNKKKCNTGCTHLTNKQKYIIDPNLKRKSKQLLQSHTGNVLHDLGFVVVRCNTKIMIHERKKCLSLDFRKMKRKKKAISL